ncbi:hypothetical protein GCM10010472_02920 [Pseudonocardia halophobica]|uniref:Carboxymuconolactone decarboxylase-like domain-containing protein n=1 Tax=Pseudonocardia halophobica TaxID=29401 RepID=A0A9W6NVQ0_9PSEU|nr:carboxymuconolactone decarboxylase family protein [Pseudonocardia halophobica]GLL10632.1 hypothetical protein GCM10017577_17720 [Pseudonocardia halophobica]
MRRAESRPVRLAPVAVEDRTERMRELLARATRSRPREVNIYSTLVRRPELFGKWLDLAHALLFDGTLSARDRELLVLRTAWNCESEYEWAQHVGFARRGGITEDEIDAVRRGPHDAVWDERSALLLAAADQVHDRATMDDAVWDGLGKHFDDDLRYEIVMVVGIYHMVAMMLNTFGVQLDPELPR